MRTATGAHRSPERFAAKSSRRRCNRFFPITAHSIRRVRDKSPPPTHCGQRQGLRRHNWISSEMSIVHRTITCHAEALAKAGGQRPQNDDIVLRFHFEFGRECMLTSHRKANIKHFLGVGGLRVCIRKCHCHVERSETSLVYFR